jgi:hypothetical protein
LEWAPNKRAGIYGEYVAHHTSLQGGGDWSSVIVGITLDLDAVR